MSDMNSLMDKIGDLLQLEVEALIKERDTLRTRVDELDSERIKYMHKFRDVKIINGSYRDIVEKAREVMRWFDNPHPNPHPLPVVNELREALAKLKGGEDE